MKRIVFRADASGAVGYGHFIRSLALAGYLKNEFECWFATFNSDNANNFFLPTDYQFNEIFKIGQPLAVIGKNIDQYNQDFLDELNPSDVVVLDNYYFSTKYQQSIKDKGCKLVCIDDLHDRHMICDLLLTPSPLSREDFSLEEYTKFAGGIEWAFLRAPFFTPMPVRNVKSDIRRIVMAMGGADAFHLTDKMVEIVTHMMSNTQIDVICGETVKVSDKTETCANIHRCLSAGEIVKLFDESDIGIFPASTICIEAFSRKLPVIGGYYVDNQIDFYNYCTTHGLFAPLGCMLDDAVRLEKSLSEIFENKRPLPVIIDFKSKKEKVIDLFRSL